MSTTPMNPLLKPWTGAYGGLPSWGEYSPPHFLPALTEAMALNIKEVEAIASNPEPPTFENTVRALDRSGTSLSRVTRILSHLCASVTSPELQAVELESAPLLAAHTNKLYMQIPGLFERVCAVHAAKGTLECPQSARLVERTHLDFVRAGAKLDPQSKARYGEVMESLATLQTSFSQNVLKDESECTLSVGEEELEGCPGDLVEGAKQASLDRGGAPGTLTLSLSRSQVEPILTYASRRALRERLWRQWSQRGELACPSRDNKPLIQAILRLRCEQAALHGYPTFAAYQLADTMATGPERVMELLEDVWARARACGERERAALEASAGMEAGSLQPWDWRYYAERERTALYDFDEASIKPYLSLEAVTAAIFDCAGQLFGLRFVRTDLPGYHPDVVVYEVRETVGGEDTLVGIFCADNFARPNKRGGAWMSELRTAHRDGERVLPIVCNNNNFSRGSPTTLLSFDDAVTAFHEFGHGLHGLLSEATYAGLAGTSVLRDFVELPSQLFEHWLSEPEVLRKHARHVESGAPLPEELLAKLKRAQKYGAGFATSEYTACALIDQAFHTLTASEIEALDVGAFEGATLARLGMPQGIALRHRPTHFDHLFSGSSYASAYYVYIWAEVLDADAFLAFKEEGDIFHGPTAAKLRKHIYGAGNSGEPGALYRAFRGRDPKIEAMLAKKGLL